MESRTAPTFTPYKNNKDFLQTLANNHDITQDGKEWLTLALDPFHDYNHQIAGYPDADASQTVVSCYQYQMDLTKPPLAGAVNWDAHVYTTPACMAENLSLFNLSADWKTTTEPNPAIQTSWAHAPLVITTNTQGSNMFPVTPLPVADIPVTVTLPAKGSVDLCSGITRVIGMGFEITNTTAEISKQGSLTVYRMPQRGDPYQMRTVSNGTLVAPVTGTMWREAPSSLAQINLLKGTRTWAASEGCYCTVLQNSVSNPMKQVESGQILYSKESDTGEVQLIKASQYDAVGAAAVSPNATAVAFAPNQTMPFDTTGVYLSGLSPTTTLTIKLKVYVERAPTWSDPQLAVLASPSAGYDVRVLELYAQAINHLPPGVKVNENAFGDWWRAVTSVLKGAAGTVGMALNPFIPGAGIVGNSIGVAAGALGDMSKVFNTSKGQSISKQVVQQQAQNQRNKQMASRVVLVQQKTKPKPKPKKTRK